jgi:hypothetical protein
LNTGVVLVVKTVFVTVVVVVLVGVETTSMLSMMVSKP